MWRGNSGGDRCRKNDGSSIAPVMTGRFQGIGHDSELAIVVIVEDSQRAGVGHHLAEQAGSIGVEILPGAERRIACY